MVSCRGKHINSLEDLFKEKLVSFSAEWHKDFSIFQREELSILSCILSVK